MNPFSGSTQPDTLSTPSDAPSQPRSESPRCMDHDPEQPPAKFRRTDGSVVLGGVLPSVPARAWRGRDSTPPSVFRPPGAPKALGSEVSDVEALLRLSTPGASPRHARASPRLLQEGGVSCSGHGANGVRDSAGALAAGPSQRPGGSEASGRFGLGRPCSLEHFLSSNGSKLQSYCSLPRPVSPPPVLADDLFVPLRPDGPRQDPLGSPLLPVGAGALAVLEQLVVPLSGPTDCGSGRVPLVAPSQPDAASTGPNAVDSAIQGRICAVCGCTCIPSNELEAERAVFWSLRKALCDGCTLKAVSRLVGGTSSPLAAWELSCSSRIVADREGGRRYSSCPSCQGRGCASCTSSYVSSSPSAISSIGGGCSCRQSSCIECLDRALCRSSTVSLSSSGSPVGSNNASVGTEEDSSLSDGVEDTPLFPLEELAQETEGASLSRRVMLKRKHFPF